MRFKEGFSLTALTGCFGQLVLTVLLLLSFLGFNPVLVHAAKLCIVTSKDMLKSCKSGVQADYSLALAKCDNVPFSLVGTCKSQAETDMKAGKDDCKAQFDARRSICKSFGEGIYDPVINPSDFSTTIDNPLFPLSPGTTFVYGGLTEKGNEYEEVRVTSNTKTILGVTCVEVRDTVRVNGVLVEDTLDWYAQDKDGNVWYFGEKSVEYDTNGEIVSFEGSWTAGVDGAKPGIIMEAQPKVGDLYRQEFALGTAEDIAQVVGTYESVTVHAVKYDNCLKTKEFSPLEPDVMENKFYAPNVGNIQTVDVATGNHLDLIQKTR
jgi:hypothetical protein